MRFLHRLGFDDDVRKLDVFAIEGRLVRSPGFLQCRDVFVGQRAARLEGHVEAVELMLQVTDGSAQGEAATGDEFHGGDLLGEQQRMTVGQHQHEGQHVDARGRSHQHRGGGDAFDETRAHVLGHGRGHDDMLGNGEPVPGQAVGLPGKTQDFLAAGVGFPGRHGGWIVVHAAGGECEFHELLLSSQVMPGGCSHYCKAASLSDQ